MKGWAGGLVLGAVAALIPAAASAALKLCNRTSYIVYVASAYQAGATVEVKGWTRILPGGCADALATPLDRGTAYVYARTSRAYSGVTRAWGGKTLLCARDGGFSLTMPAGDDNCEVKQAFPLPFAPIDAKGQADRTITLYQSADRVSAIAARDAGLIRLLRDAGERQASPVAALNAFRTRMKMPANASVAAMFDALEPQAMQISAPAGYTICNDTQHAAFAALAYRDGQRIHTQGWWQVSSGACAQAMSEPLKTAHVWLLAEDASGRKLVSGPDQYCVTQIPFDVDVRDNCQAHGLVSAGFARTDVAGSSGYVAHIGETGLILPQQTLE